MLNVSWKSVAISRPYDHILLLFPPTICLLLFFWDQYKVKNALSWTIAWSTPITEAQYWTWKLCSKKTPRHCHPCRQARYPRPWQQPRSPLQPTPSTSPPALSSTTNPSSWTSSKAARSSSTPRVNSLCPEIILPTNPGYVSHFRHFPVVLRQFSILTLKLSKTQNLSVTDKLTVTYTKSYSPRHCL